MFLLRITIPSTDGVLIGNVAMESDDVIDVASRFLRVIGSMHFLKQKLNEF